MKNDKKPHVLIVDDVNINLELISRLVESCEFEAIVAHSYAEALEKIQVSKPDLILMDVVLPDMDGFAAAKMLKGNPETEDIPIIFITAKDDKDDIIEGFDSGGVDYVTKSFHSKELIMRIKTHLELKLSRDKIKEHALELATANETLSKMIVEVEQASKTDFLTGLFNRKYLFDIVEIEKVRFKRNKKAFSIVLCDIDYFKTFNDNYGHNCGDYILKDLAAIFKQSAREQDVISRWGGEEFLFLLPETPSSGAKVLVDRINFNIRKSNLKIGDIPLAVTLTYGISTYEGEEDIDCFIKRADEALYEGKNNGRNCAVYYTDNSVIIENNEAPSH